MKLKLMTLAAFTLILFSCQKESDNGGGGNSNTNEPLLTRMVNTIGSDSTVTLLSYNAAKKLTYYRFDGKDDSGAPVDVQQFLTRNSQNVVTQVVLKSNQLTQVGLDSIVSKLNYNSGTSRYTSRVTSIELFGFSFMDSLVFNYDASGKITSEIDYAGDATSGYEIASKTEYTYVGSNLTMIRYYSYDTGTGQYTLEETDTIEYDAKTAPLVMSTEAIAIGVPAWFSANNYTKRTIVSSTDPTLNDVETTTYTYTAKDRPLTSISTSQSGQSSTTRYYYQ
jgi:hypothetical protein